MEKVDLRADLESRMYQPKKKSEVPKWIFFSSIAALFIGGLLYLNKDKMAIIFDGPGGQYVHFMKPYMKHYLEQKPQTPLIEVEYVFPAREVRPPRPAAVRPEDVTSPHIEQWEREWKAKQEANLEKKQTVFNESNYTPREITNSIPAPKEIYTNNRSKPKNTYRKTHSIPWTWQSYGSGFSKHNKYGKFTYVETERGIDTESVCRNYKYGSLDYRDCRKAAKKWFQDRCSSDFRNACVAGNMIP